MSMSNEGIMSRAQLLSANIVDFYVFIKHEGLTAVHADALSAISSYQNRRALMKRVAEYLYISRQEVIIVCEFQEVGPDDAAASVVATSMGGHP